MSSTNVAELSSKAKLAYLRECVLDIRAGGGKAILCPYCGDMNHQTNEFLCCALFVEAMDAVVTRLDEEDKMDFICNVYDRVN